MSGAPTFEEFNSYRIFVRDSAGDAFLWTLATNSPGAIDASRKHARWYIQHCKRPGAHKDTDSSGRPVRRPVGECEVVVEFYNDESFRAPRRRKRAA